MMRIDIISIFPEYLSALRLSLVGKATESGLVDIAVHDLRDWATDRHRTVDDSPYGGGPGMVMKPDVWGAAVDEVLARPPVAGVGATLVVPSPTGVPLTHAIAENLSTHPWLVFLPARYEGIDARVMEHYRHRAEVTEVLECSIGDFVLAGGEAAVLVIVEALARFIPGVLGNDDSVADDSFAAGMHGLLAPPVFTRPPVWRDLAVPDVLLSGDHARIAQWRREQSLKLTHKLRPDLLDQESASPE